MRGLAKIILIVLTLTWIISPSFAEKSAPMSPKEIEKNYYKKQHAAAHHSHKKKHHPVKHATKKHIAHSKKIKHTAKIKHRKPQIYQDSLEDDVSEAINTPKITEANDTATTIAETKPVTMGFTSSMTKKIVDFVSKTVDTLHYSVYKLGGKHFDTKKGVYIVDCSAFVDKILQNVCPRAYSSLVDATGADAPASKHYYNFFTELASDPDSYWNKVDDVGNLRAGDILVIRYKNRHGIETGGHVMVVMNQPERDTDVYYVRVADSAPTRHSDDTREYDTSGIGIGTLLLKANSRNGQPIAYAWGIGGYWNKNANFAMARPVDVG